MADNRSIPKLYDPVAVEEKWCSWWEEHGFARAEVDASKPYYSIVLPPPNVTGSLHMGHALNITLQDVLIRWKRMQGFDVLWLPGTDHAGIATQNVVERRLAEEGRQRTDLGREQFEKIVWDWKDKAEEDILNQVRRLGCSCDWSRKRFTLDEGLSRAVREVFVRLYEDGLIYRGEYLVNWCPRCTTAISDLEVEYKPVPGKLWYIRYPLEMSDDVLVVATTRPETMLGDTAVAVHPHDERYKRLVGSTVVLPLADRKIPVIADDFVDQEFGTGTVKITPGHDPNDFEAGRRHQLPIVKVIGEDGHMTQEAGVYAGMDRYEARDKIITDLQGQELIEQVEEYDHNVGQCQRCETVVEPLVSKQWFVKAKPLAEVTVEAVKAKRTVFVPKNYERIYFEWMNNIHDWCISRQLWWGHRIPAWYCGDCQKLTVAREVPSNCEHCQSNSLEQETDVLDTWFSSALWPFSTMGWPDQTTDLERYYPTTTLVTGFDIIFFWVARMMMMGLKFMNDVPFRTVHINGLVRDEKGKKMSKSRGNVINPLQVMDEYGTDAMRFTLAIMATPGTDIPFSISRMAGYRAFCNKIWNAGRFLLLNLENQGPISKDEMDTLKKSEQLNLGERWILSRLQRVILDTNDNLEKFRFHEVSNELYHFFWHDFCDWFVEYAKLNMTGVDLEKKNRTCRVALYVLEESLKLLHPFIPFITEELWHALPHSGDSLMQTRYPIACSQWVDVEAEEQMVGFQELVTKIRTARSENNIDPRKRIPIQLACQQESKSFLEWQIDPIKSLAHLDEVELVPHLTIQEAQIRGVSQLADFALTLGDIIDVKSERHRITQQISRNEDNVQRLQKQLQNSEFVNKAPENVVATARERHAEAVKQLEKLREKLDELPQS